MFTVKKLKVNLTMNELGEYGAVFWLDTKSEPHAHGLTKQIVEMLQAANRGANPVEAGQLIKGPFNGPIIKP